MVMDIVQLRVSHGLMKKVDQLVKTGIYSNRSDVIRDAIRRLVLNQMVGIIPDKKDSVKEVRAIRKRLSKEAFNLKEINKLAD